MIVWYMYANYSNMNEQLQFNIEILQSSVATCLRRDGTFYSSFLCISSTNTTVKALNYQKSVHICQSYCKNKTALFMHHSVYIMVPVAPFLSSL